jgi:hypothetical protein
VVEKKGAWDTNLNFEKIINQLYVPERGIVREWSVASARRFFVLQHRTILHCVAVPRKAFALDCSFAEFCLDVDRLRLSGLFSAAVARSPS